MTRAIFVLFAALAGVVSLRGQETASIRLVPTSRERAEEARGSGPSFHAVYAEGETAARERGVPLVLYFTAKWCGPCRRMEQGAFRDPGVLAALAGFELCKLDIDLVANREICARHHRGGAVPAFVVLATDGREVHEWSGALEPAGLLGELATAAKSASTPPADAGPVALAEFACARCDLEALAQQLAVLAQRGATDDVAQIERLAWLACTTAFDLQRWPELARAAQGYLERFPEGEHADEARIVLGRATFAADGVVTEPLRAHIEALLADCAAPFPGDSLLQRAKGFIGARGQQTSEQSDAASAWVRRVNASMARLHHLGVAAVPALRRELLHGNGQAMSHAATALGRMKLPENVLFLREQLAEQREPVGRRAQMVRALAMHKDPGCLPLFLGLARVDEPAMIRAEAVDALRDICLLTDGSADPAVAQALDTALTSRDRNLRERTLQAMFKVRAALSLENLLEVLHDRRPLFAEYRLCDNALWIIGQQLGMQVEVDGKGVSTCTPAIASFLERWYSANRTQLAWDEANERWIVRDAAAGQGK